MRGGTASQLARGRRRDPILWRGHNLLRDTLFVGVVTVGRYVSLDLILWPGGPLNPLKGIIERCIVQAGPGSSPQVRGRIAPRGGSTPGRSRASTRRQWSVGRGGDL